VAVNFSASAAGVTKSIPRWGIEVVQFNQGNTVNWINAIGGNNIDVVASLFWMDEPLASNGDIGPNSKSNIDYEEYLIGLVGGSQQHIQLQAATGSGVNAYYYEGAPGGQVNVQRWANMINASAAYYSHPIDQIVPFNEPDYGWGQGTGQNLYDIMGLINVPGAVMSGPSTLNCDWALPWYDAIKGRPVLGGTHAISGSMQSYIDFINYVLAHNQIASNPELHSLAEAIVGAQYGLDEGIWWAGPNVPRSAFVLDCKYGKQLGYAEQRNNWCAAAVYRAADGSIHGYASGYEHYATSTTFTFHSTDGPVYYNGVGPQTDYTITVGSGVDSIVDISTTPPSFPTGSGLKLSNRASGLKLAANGNGNGANLIVANNANNGPSATAQKWTITLVGNGLYSIRSAQNGSRAADCYGQSSANGANIALWDFFAQPNQLWRPVNLGNGYWRLDTASAAGQCMEATGSSNGSNVQLWSYSGGLNQQWSVGP